MESTTEFTVPPPSEKSPRADREPPKKLPTALLKSGTELGDYRIEEKIGQGAMGEVYRARQISLDRVVALKLMLSKDARKDVTLVERFQREARTLSELDHPHIVKAVGTGEINGQLFAALEYINGRPLDAWLEELGHFSVGDALHVTLVCAWALQHAHDRGCIHRDVKAANVLVTKDGRCKIADFGIAKVAQADMAVTSTGASLGTPDYMSPEQCVDPRNVTARTDIYALGVMLYAMLTGELPFKASTLVEVVKMKQLGVFKPAKSLNPDVPSRVDLILTKMLCADPDHRYATCDEVIHDIALTHRHSESLSFVGAAQAAVVFGPWNSIIAEAASKNASSADPQQRASHTPSPAPIKSGDTLWYVHHKNKLGKSVVSKMMTDELISALEKRLVPLTAQIKSAPNAPFTSIADHAEFHPVLQRLGVKIVPRKASAPGQSGTPGKRRRRKRPESVDLLGRIVLCLLAASTASLNSC